MLRDWAWDGNHLLLTIAMLFLIWWVVGRELNRRRTRALLATIGAALPTLGAGATYRPVGSTAFQVTVAAPVPPLSSVSMLCLLEARDFPLAWVWTRWRGRRDQIVLRADFAQAPAAPAGPEAPGLRQLLLCAVQPTSPHLQLSWNVPPGQESQVATGFTAVVTIARQLSADVS